MNCLASVIVPVYNEEKYLEACIESLVNQTVDYYEIILVDDGSTDKSGEICDKYASDKVRVIHQKNSGVSAARNAGLDAAKGEYIIFVDSDDVVKSDYVEAFFDGLEDYKDDLIVTGRKIFNTVNGEEVDEWADEFCVYEANEWVKPIRDKITRSIVYCRRFKKSLIDENNLRFDTELTNSEDEVFIYEYLRIMKNRKIVMVPKYTYDRYMRPGSLICKKYSDRFTDVSKVVYNQFLKTANEVGFSDESDKAYIYGKFLHDFCKCFTETFRARDTSLWQKYKIARRVITSEEYKTCLKYADKKQYSALRRSILNSKSVLLIFLLFCTDYLHR